MSLIQKKKMWRRRRVNFMVVLLLLVNISSVTARAESDTQFLTASEETVSGGDIVLEQESFAKVDIEHRPVLGGAMAFRIERENSAKLELYELADDTLEINAYGEEDNAKASILLCRNDEVSIRRSMLTVVNAETVEKEDSTVATSPKMGDNFRWMVIIAIIGLGAGMVGIIILKQKQILS